MNDKAMKYIIALLSSLILTSCSMFNNEAPYKRFFSEKEYPIIQAIHDCDKDKILDMMHKGWNVNTMGKHGMSYLLYAVWEHNYDMTKFLLENGADPNFVSVFWDETPEETVCMLPLEGTCYDKYGMNYMKLLLEYGANPNDTRAQLPLFAAALYEVTLDVSSFLATLQPTEWKRHTAASHGMTQPLEMWLGNYAQKLRYSWS